MSGAIFFIILIFSVFAFVSLAYTILNILRARRSDPMIFERVILKFEKGDVRNPSEAGAIPPFTGSHQALTSLRV